MPTSPILPGFHPDPSWCRVGGDYCMVTSTFAWLPGVPILHSSDLENWTPIGNVLDRPSRIGLEHTDLWASFGISRRPLMDGHDVDRHRGPQNFLVTPDDPAGPWSAQ